MNDTTITQKMNTLIAKIKEADTAYYRDDSPIMTDREYDLLMDELKELEPTSGILLSGSPTQSVPGENSGFPPTREAHPAHAFRGLPMTKEAVSPASSGCHLWSDSPRYLHCGDWWKGIHAQENGVAGYLIWVRPLLGYSSRELI